MSHITTWRASDAAPFSSNLWGIQDCKSSYLLWVAGGIPNVNCWSTLLPTKREKSWLQLPVTLGIFLLGISSYHCLEQYYLLIFVFLCRQGMIVSWDCLSARGWLEACPVPILVFFSHWKKPVITVWFAFLCSISIPPCLLLYVKMMYPLPFCLPLHTTNSHQIYFCKKLVVIVH